MKRYSYLAQLERVTKLIALAQSTQYQAERDVAQRKASEIAIRAGIRSVTYRGMVYLFRPRSTPASSRKRRSG